MATVNTVMYLQNKNKANRHLKQVLHYNAAAAGRLILNGVNEFNDSIFVVLDKVKSDYPLFRKNRE